MNHQLKINFYKNYYVFPKNEKNVISLKVVSNIELKKNIVTLVY